MPDIKIDLDALESMVIELNSITTGFTRADEFSDAVAGAVGHPGLESVLHDFAGKWNIHREKILAKLAFVTDSTVSIHDTFVELDKRLAERAEQVGEKIAGAGITEPGR